MSIITKALLEGEMIIGLVDVDNVIDFVGGGTAYSGGEGRVKSNIGGEEE